MHFITSDLQLTHILLTGIQLDMAPDQSSACHCDLVSAGEPRKEPTHDRDTKGAVGLVSSLVCGCVGDTLLTNGEHLRLG